MGLMEIPATRESCRKVSELAAKKARESVRSFGWSDKSLEALVPLEGTDGHVGVRAKQKYLMFQNQGIKSFLMTWVEGRTIPLGCKKGDGPHLVRGAHVGEPGWVNIPHVGRVYRSQRWRHPGLKPKHFLEDAINAAIAELQGEVKADLIRALEGGGGNV